MFALEILLPHQKIFLPYGGTTFSHMACEYILDIPSNWMEYSKMILS
jgi:hypothetical protein